jgi:hypothetical protein
MRHLTDRYRSAGLGPNGSRSMPGMQARSLSKARAIKWASRRSAASSFRFAGGSRRDGAPLKVHMANGLESDRPARNVVGVSDVAGLPVSGLRPRGALLPHRCSRQPL